MNTSGGGGGGGEHIRRRRRLRRLRRLTHPPAAAAAGMMSHVAERRGCGVIADATGRRVPVRRANVTGRADVGRARDRAGQQNRGSGGGRSDSESVVTATVTVAESATARADQIHYPAFRTWVPVCGCATVFCTAVRSLGPVQWSMGKTCWARSIRGPIPSRLNRIRLLGESLDADAF